MIILATGLVYRHLIVWEFNLESTLTDAVSDVSTLIV